MHCDYTHSLSLTHTSPLSHGHPTLHNRSPDIHPSPSPWLGSNGVGGGAEDRPQIQPVSFPLYETWVVHTHCMGHQGSPSRLTEKGHFVLYPRDMTPSSPSPLPRTPTVAQLLCGLPHLSPAPPFTTRPQPSAALEAAEGGTNETGMPAAPGQGRVSQTLVEAGGS